MRGSPLIVGPHRPPRRIGHRAFRVGASLVVLALIIARLFFFELVVVRGNTMAPTALEGDVLLVHRSRTPNLGDVVLVDTDDAGPVIRRIIGWSGDALMVEDGVISRNGHPLESRRVGSFAYQEPEEVEMPPRRQHFIRENAEDGLQYHVLGDHVGNVRPWTLTFEPVTVPEGQVFVLCDNRPVCPEGPPGHLISINDVVGVIGVPLWFGEARVDAPEGPKKEP